MIFLYGILCLAIVPFLLFTPLNQLVDILKESLLIFSNFCLFFVNVRQYFVEAFSAFAIFRDFFRFLSL